MTVPAKLWARPTMVLRPRDLADLYARPDLEVARLADHGVLRHVAHGYWVLPPIDQVENPDWRPEVETLALALAVADYGTRTTALTGPSAARHHGALPRALATATVAVPRQRPALDTAYGRIVFVKRDTGRLDLARARTLLVVGYATTIEQTMLDIANRPGLGALPPDEAATAIRALAARADWAEVQRLAREQRAPAAYARARWAADGVLDGTVPILRPRTPIPALGLKPVAADAARFGVRED